METPGPRPLLLLWVLAAAALAGDGDFDLADALDDPEPTTKPGGGLYPRLPQDPHGGGIGGEGDPGARPGWGGASDIYPPPRPRPPPQPRPPPRPRPPPHHDYVGGFGGLSGEGDPGAQPGRGGAFGRQEPSPPVDSTQGSAVARIVSPIVSVAVVALLGAGAAYFRSRGCLGGSRGGSAPV